LSFVHLYALTSADHEVGRANALMRLYSYRNLRVSKIWFANMRRGECEIMD
jgi:hypothetical protein